MKFRRQVVYVDLATGCHDREPVAGVFQLANVARPLQRLEILQRLLAQYLPLAAEVPRRLVEEVLGEQRDVRTAFGKRRHMDADDIQTVIEVFAEGAVGDEGAQVAVSGGDDADVHLDAHSTPDPVELPLGQHPQQPGLGFRRHVADLVEEKRAAVGLFETTDALILGAGERAPFVAEQFRLDQLARYGRHVQRHHCVRRPRTVPVQCPRHQFLAGAGGALDHDRDIRLGQSTNGTEHFLHRRRLADDVRNVAHQVGVLLGLLPANEHGPTDGGNGLVDVERLRQVLEGAGLVGADGAVQVRVGRHDDHG